MFRSNKNIMQWFTKQLLQHISGNAVTVVNNVAYHNKPKEKKDMGNWLDEHNIQYDDKDKIMTLR